MLYFTTLCATGTTLKCNTSRIKGVNQYINILSTYKYIYIIH